MRIEGKERIKKPTTFQEQIDILKERGMIIEDERVALDLLSRINYYRFSAYALSYKHKNRYYHGVSFHKVKNLYDFDKKLRNLLLGALETIEISFRTHIAYLLAHKYGALGYMNPSNFINKQLHADIMKKLNFEIERSRELFIAHHKKEYEGVFPVWVAIEVIPFGLLSKMYSNLKKEDKEEISKNYYNLPHKYIKSWLHVLATVRNICAHFGRIYNKKLTIKPLLHRKDIEAEIKNDTIIAVLAIMGKLIKDKAEWRSFLTNIKALIEQYEDVDIRLMGFPDNWEQIIY